MLKRKDILFENHISIDVKFLGGYSIHLIAFLCDRVAQKTTGIALGVNLFVFLIVVIYPRQPKTLICCKEGECPNMISKGDLP